LNCEPILIRPDQCQRNAVHTWPDTVIIMECDSQRIGAPDRHATIIAPPPIGTATICAVDFATVGCGNFVFCRASGCRINT
jgi:hypothetical protein